MAPPAGGVARRRPRGGIALAVALALSLVACRGAGGASSRLDPAATTTPGSASTTPPTDGAGPSASEPSAGGVASDPGVATSTSSPRGSAGAATSAPPASPPPTTPSAARALRLGGNDLGVTTVGAGFRDGVAAVSALLGSPVGDPATDSACIGAQDETSWNGFRLAGNTGKVTGWRSTSPALATPAGIAAGATLAALNKAYGDKVQVRGPSEFSVALFLVAGAELDGTLSGPDPTDTVTSISSGTCRAT